jgi:small-conductance mechanosensitive channel/CRP-like cAMP-binding protein
MHFAHELVALGLRFATPWLFLAFVVARASALRAPTSDARSRLGFALSFLGLHIVLLPAVAGLSVAGRPMHALEVVTGLLGTIAFVGFGGVILFDGIVARIRPGLPRIVPDVVTTLAAFIAILRTSSSMGFELSGIIATSAVLTAVIGLSLQDTLGNIVGGLSVQLDQSIRVDDWVKLGDLTGRISEIRWRYTAIETRDWETVVVPNSQLTRGQVVVLGRRQNSPLQLRRWVNFRVDYRFAPSDVIEVIEGALRAHPIPGVAATPPPQCIAHEFGESSIHYAVRYWLTDIPEDDPTDSLVRTRIFFALARAKMRLAIPAQAVFMTSESQARAESKRAADLDLRVAALAQNELFGALSETERAALAESLHPAPFAKGETVTREGDAAYHLYTILEGEISVRIGGLSEAHEVARLGPGAFFGEMAVLTGQRRRATCIAITRVECYRLDASAFRDLLAARPELAERVAKILAEREVGMRVTLERIDESSRAHILARNETDLLAKIRSFFSLGNG